MSKAILLPGTGWQQVEIQNFAQIQAYCQGFIQPVYIDDATTLWCNEDGKAMGMAPNGAAIMLTAHVGLAPDDLVVGPCVVTGALDEDENYKDVPSWVAYRLSGKGSDAHNPEPGEH